MSNHRNLPRILITGIILILLALAPLVALRMADGTGKAFANPERDRLITEVSAP